MMRKKGKFSSSLFGAGDIEGIKLFLFPHIIKVLLTELSHCVTAIGLY